jgi:hypothetical protein
MARPAVLVLTVFLFSSSSANAEFYRWTDREGREFYTNEQSKIPSEYRETAKPVEVREDRVSVAAQPATPARPDLRAAAHRDKNGRGEEYWRTRAMNLRRQLRELEDEREIVAKQIEELERPVTADGVGKHTKKKKNLAGLEKKRTQLDKKIVRKRHELEVELPDQARKADAYPGWIRE